MTIIIYILITILLIIGLIGFMNSLILEKNKNRKSETVWKIALYKIFQIEYKSIQEK